MKDDSGPNLTEATDRAGGKFYRVHLSNTEKTVAMDRFDYLRLVQDGVKTFRLNRDTRGREYVKTWINGQSVQVARLILGVDKGRQTRFKDGNPLNLRRRNIRKAGRPK
jgi:hypothetical protein